MASQGRYWSRDELFAYRELVRTSLQHQRGVVRVHARKLDGKKSEAMIRQHRIIADEPAVRGGKDEAPTPLEVFLAGVALSTTHTAALVAKEMDIPYETLEVKARAHFDRRGIMDIDGVSSAFQEVLCEIHINSLANAIAIRELGKAVERRCVPLNTLKTAVQLVYRVVHNSHIAIGDETVGQESEGTI